MSLNFESAAKKYLELRNEVEGIEAEAKKKTAALKAIMADIEAWITIKANEDGLSTVPTPYGTAYWSTHYSASCANPSDFRDFVIKNQLWDLMETRVSKTAVKSYIEGNGEPPPGVNFSSVRVFNLRANKEK